MVYGGIEGMLMCKDTINLYKVQKNVINFESERRS